MKISEMNSITDTLNRLDTMLGISNKSATAKTGGTARTETNGLTEDRFELNDPNIDFSNERATYDVNSMAVDRLMRETGEIQNSVSDLVKGLLERQGVTVEMLKNGEVEEVNVDEETRQKAAEMIGPDGPLGAEKVSERIVQFAISITGGDKSKIDMIRSSIDRGFKEAEKMLGGLSEVSKETYQLIQDKLDQWMNEGNGEPTAGKVEENA